ncbi:glucose-methanol-choline oxidoreductase [Seiridium cupressi]
MRVDLLRLSGGPAGLVLANRLSEDPSLSVAIIEAGGYADNVIGNISEVPGLDFNFLITPPPTEIAEIEWGFNTTPQYIFNGSTTEYTRAKALGGCTIVHYMAYSQSSYGAFQKWADTVDDDSYTYPNFSAYYRKSMDFDASTINSRYPNATPTYDATVTVEGGPLGVSFPAFAQSWSTWVARGLEAVGIQPRGALIDGTLSGATWQINTINATTGLRASAEASYLRPVKERSNLFVFNGTLAEKVLFDGNQTATGVLVTTGTTSYTLSAAREVIISGGTFQSPQLLMVSGVGPADTLAQYDIPLVADRPGVGQGMNDHVMFGISYQANVETLSAYSVGDNLAVANAEFVANRTGPLASPGGDFVALEKLPASYRASLSNKTQEALASYPEDWPEIEFLVLPVFAGNQNTPNAASPDLPATVAGANYGTLLAVLQVPQSRGNVTISSASMSDAPVINPAWLTDARDREVFIAAFKRAREVLSVDEMKPVLIGDEFYPGPQVQTDEEIMDYIATSLGVLYHASATCAMGTADDPLAVVDSRGKVFGTKNLRVVDASALPFLPPGPGPQVTVYALAEKIADTIKNEY